MSQIKIGTLQSKTLVKDKRDEKKDEGKIEIR
jgi:hypothetical protein